MDTKYFSAVSILPAGTFWVPVESRVLCSVSVVIATLNPCAPFSFTNTSTVPIVEATLEFAGIVNTRAAVSDAGWNI